MIGMLSISHTDNLTFCEMTQGKESSKRSLLLPYNCVFCLQVCMYLSTRSNMSIHQASIYVHLKGELRNIDVYIFRGIFSV